MANMQLGNSAESITNGNFQRQQFGIANVSLVMELLSKLYSNPIQTLTQEYISNARDANREVKSTRKIEITAPTKFNAIMQIRDFGPGLSPERIKDVFLFYGASTKRNDDNQVGGFGIGSKSAFAYTDSFTVTSFINGIKYTYIIHKSNNSGQMDKVTEEKTNEPNGVMVEIAINPRDTQAFKNAILRTIFFWKENEKPIIKGVDSSEIPDIKAKFTDIANLYTYDVLPNQFPVDYNSNSIIVIDGIPYSNKGYTPLIEKKIKTRFVISIDTGHVDIAPNREELVNNERTKKYLSTLDARIIKDIELYTEKQLKNLSNIKHCIKAAIEIQKQFDVTIKYKNYDFHWNGLYISDANSKDYLILGNCWESWVKKYHKKPFNHFNFDEVEQIYYDDMPNESNTKKVWRVKKVMEKNNYKRFYLLAANLDTQIIVDLGAKPLSSIDASDYKIQRQAKIATKKLELCIHYYCRNRLASKQENISNITDTIVYDLIDSKTYIHRHSNKIIDFINSKPGTKFAFLAKGKENKVKNLNNFISFEDYLKTYKPTDDEIRFSLKSKEIDFSLFFKYKPLVPEIKDPALKYIIELATFNPGNTVSACRLPEELIDKNHKIIVEFEKYFTEIQNIDKQYPLFSSFDSYYFTKEEYKQDVINYLNSKYKGN